MIGKFWTNPDIIFPILMQSLRGTAIGVYNWGIYIGYSMSYALGNFITTADIGGKSWRWVFWIAGIPGFFVGFLMLFTVREPGRESNLQVLEQFV